MNPAGYFATLGLPIVMGRDFGPQDHEGARGVAIVNQTFARRSGRGAIRSAAALSRDTSGGAVARGRRRRQGLQVPHPGRGPAPVLLPAAVTGLRAGDDPGRARRRRSQDHARVGPPRGALVARSRICRCSTRRRCSSTSASRCSPRVSPRRVLGVFGLMAMILAAVGLYGVVAFAVAPAHARDRRARGAGARARATCRG